MSKDCEKAGGEEAEKQINRLKEELKEQKEKINKIDRRQGFTNIAKDLSKSQISILKMIANKYKK